MLPNEAHEALQAITDDLVALPGTPTYEQLVKSYLSSLQAELKPALFLSPSTPDQVAAIVKTVKPFVSADCQLAICGAGQQPAPGTANTNGGITMHLHRLQGIEIDTDRMVVSVGAGERIGRVYEKVTALGLGVSGSRAAEGGIGGLSTSEGLSYFSSARGFICDDVVNFQVVLASGEIVNANAQENPDLWVALKGGSNNFGIVVRFDLHVFEQGKMWGGKLYYFPLSFSSQVQSMVEFVTTPKHDVDTHVFINIGYAAAFGAVMCMNNIFYTKPTKPDALAPFVDIQPQLDQMNTLRADTLHGFAKEQSAGAQVQKRTNYRTTTLRANVEAIQMAVDKFLASVETIRDVANITFALTLQPFPVSLMEQSLVRGTNSLGLDPSNGSLIQVLVFTSWDEADDDTKVFGANHRLIQEIDEAAATLGMGSPYRALNYASTDQDPISSYGPDANTMLQAVRLKYDPERFFQGKVSGPFKLRAEGVQ